MLVRNTQLPLEMGEKASIERDTWPMPFYFHAEGTTLTKAEREECQVCDIPTHWKWEAGTVTDKGKFGWGQSLRILDTLGLVLEIRAVIKNFRNPLWKRPGIDVPEKSGFPVGHQTDHGSLETSDWTDWYPVLGEKERIRRKRRKPQTQVFLDLWEISGTKLGFDKIN